MLQKPKKALSSSASSFINAGGKNPVKKSEKQATKSFELKLPVEFHRKLKIYGFENTIKLSSLLLELVEIGSKEMHKKDSKFPVLDR